MIGLILTIMGINIVYVAAFTLRLILLIKGYRVGASILSMVEVFIYLMGLTIVLDNLDNPLNIAAYCLGFGLGVYAGSRIEEYLALGYLTVQVVVDSLQQSLPNQLREEGFGVTAWPAEGKDGSRLVMTVLVKRKREYELMQIIQKHAPKAFVISHEPKEIRGGFWVRRLK